MQKQETIAVPAPTQETKPMAQNTSTPVAPFEMTLRSKGFLTLNEKDAREVAFRISGEMKSGKIVGIKSFDGKVHFVMRNYFELIKDKIAKVLKEDMEVATVANLIKTENEGALTVLLLLAENGEILERRKGVFAPV